jgi:hypothetical protein
VAAPVGARISVRIRAVCDRGECDLIRGELVVPEKMDNMGAPGTLIVPRNREKAFVYLHAAVVDGERRYIAAHSSVGIE